ncbi:hypothetical protein ACGFXC_34165 [Streptomyces sp. NPDC048507]|uniref:hypothetical protein n=1 Tax=Streptomyces sp. NPDC048507 TaxID=3365560 RepID=UPI00370FD6F9
MLSVELEGLVAQLAALDRPVVPWLIQGVDAHQVQEQFGSPVPEEVAAWFEWCNGVALHEGQTQDDVNLIPGYSPLSLREAVEMKGGHDGDPILGPKWIPILGGPSGDIYAAVWVSNENPRVAGILVGEPTEIEFESIEQMISVFRACYDRGAFSVDSQGRLSMDPESYDVVYAEIVG